MQELLRELLTNGQQVALMRSGKKYFPELTGDLSMHVYDGTLLLTNARVLTPPIDGIKDVIVHPVHDDCGLFGIHYMNEEKQEFPWVAQIAPRYISRDNPDYLVPGSTAVEGRNLRETRTFYAQTGWLSVDFDHIEFRGKSWYTWPVYDIVFEQLMSLEEEPSYYDYLKSLL